MRTLPLGVRIVLLVVPLALLPLVTVGGITYYYLEATVRTESDAAHLRRLGDQHVSHERALAGVQTLAHVMASLPQVTRLAGAGPGAGPVAGDVASARQAIEVSMQLSRIVSRVTLARRDGSPVLTTPAEDAVAAGAAAVVAAGAVRHELPAGGERFLVAAGSEGPAAGVVHRVVPYRSGFLLIVFIDLGRLMKDIEPPAGGAAGSLLLLDGTGAIAARSAPVPHVAPPEALQAAIRRSAAGPQRLDLDAGVEGYDVLVAATMPIVDLRAPGRDLRPMYLVYLAQKLPLVARLNELRRMAMFLAGVSLAFGLIGAGLLARSVVHPISALLDMTKLLGEGQFDVRLQKVRDDEIGQLVEAFNTMASSIADYRDKLIRAETFAALGRVASTVAHEVRNPLNAMRGCIEYLQLKRPDDAVVQHHAGIIGEEIAQLDGFVSDFLRVTRLERPRLATTDLGELLRSRAALHDAAADARGVRIAVAIRHDPIRVLADPQQIGIVFENLINNAIDAMPDGGNLRVVATPDGARAAVSVTDSGEGIPPEIQKELFTPFFSTKTEGTGIGLAFSRRIVDAHGGTMTVESVVGTGTTFHVRLPLAPSAGSVDSSTAVEPNDETSAGPAENL